MSVTSIIQHTSTTFTGTTCTIGLGGGLTPIAVTPGNSIILAVSMGQGGAGDGSITATFSDPDGNNTYQQVSGAAAQDATNNYAGDVWWVASCVSHAPNGLIQAKVTTSASTAIGVAMYEVAGVSGFTPTGGKVTGVHISLTGGQFSGPSFNPGNGLSFYLTALAGTGAQHNTLPVASVVPNSPPWVLTEANPGIPISVATLVNNQAQQSSWVVPGNFFGCAYGAVFPGAPVGNVVDCRNYGTFPNKSRDVNGTLIFDVQTSSNPAVPETDSRTFGAPVDSRAFSSVPQNSRTPTS
jgi:hypothetical protein